MALKMKPADYATLKSAVAPLDTLERRKRYLAGDFTNAQACRDVNMRYRWDLLHTSGLRIGDGVGVKGDLDLYSYLNDEHIDSALKSMVPDLA